MLLPSVPNRGVTTYAARRQGLVGRSHPQFFKRGGHPSFGVAPEEARERMLTVEVATQ